MSSKVEKEKVDDLMSRIRDDFPDLTIVWKDEGYPNEFIPKMIEWFVFFVGLVSSSFQERFHMEISNGVRHYLFLPSKDTYGDFQDRHVYKILRHEYRHMLDMKGARFPWFMGTYLMGPLPSILAIGRAYWEFRGYAQNLIVEYEETGSIDTSSIEWYVDQFCNSTYFWMLPFRSFMRSRFMKLKKKIESEEITGMGESVSLFRI